MKIVDREQLKTRCVALLGLKPEAYLLESTETLAAALRRVAGFSCPCSSATLIRGAMQPLRELVPDPLATREVLEELLDRLIALGDLFEFQDYSDPSVSVVYTAPCGFVRRKSGSVVLVGISSDEGSPLPQQFDSRVEYNGCSRIMRPHQSEELRSELLSLGLIELPLEQWIKAPSALSADRHIEKWDHALASTSCSTVVAGLLIIDPTKPVDFYRGRWTVPQGRTGRFVARRSQTYGSPLWCYVELLDGRSVRLLDLPGPRSRWRGCDEAWHLQMAIDARLFRPQVFTVKTVHPGAKDLILHSPIPAWAERRWSAIGERLATRDGLFGFRIQEPEFEEECDFAQSSLWMVTSNIDRS